MTRPPTITATYEQGDIIDVMVNLTANHGGFFVFQLCSADDSLREVDEDCLNDNNLRIVREGSEVANSIEANLNVLRRRDIKEERREKQREERNETAKRNHIDDIALLTNQTDASYESYDGPASLEAIGESTNTESNKTETGKENSGEINGEIDSEIDGEIGNEIDLQTDTNLTMPIRTVRRYNLFNPVDLDDHSYDAFKYQVPFESPRSYTFKVKLPNEISCERCVLRWIYVSGSLSKSLLKIWKFKNNLFIKRSLATLGM